MMVAQTEFAHQHFARAHRSGFVPGLNANAGRAPASEGFLVQHRSCGGIYKESLLGLIHFDDSHRQPIAALQRNFRFGGGSLRAKRRRCEQTNETRAHKQKQASSNSHYRLACGSIAWSIRSRIALRIRRNAPSSRKSRDAQFAPMASD